MNSAGVRVLLWVDDLLARGLKADTDAFHDALEARLECREGARQYLAYDRCHLEYCGLKLSIAAADASAGDLYSIYTVLVRVMSSHLLVGFLSRL